jgi:L-lactate dehydrogenase complex protein LldE
LRIILFIPCFVDQLFPSVGISTVRIFENSGTPLILGRRFFVAANHCSTADTGRKPAGSPHGCCRPWPDRIPSWCPPAPVRRWVKNFYPELFRKTPQAEAAVQLSQRVFEFSSFLVDQLGVTELGSRFPAKVTFHDGCHGLRELHVKQQPRRLLERVKDLTLVEMEDQTSCCGFGGTFAVKFPMISTAMGETKSASALETGAEYLVSNDSSCLMHLQGLLSRQNQKLKTIHLAEVLASS